MPVSSIGFLIVSHISPDWNQLTGTSNLESPTGTHKSSKKNLFLPAKESGKFRPNRKTRTHSHCGFSRTEWGNFYPFLPQWSRLPNRASAVGSYWGWTSTPSKQQEDLRKWWEKGRCGILGGEVWAPLCFTPPQVIQVNRAQWEAEPPHSCGCNETEWGRAKQD